jgi:hypothetical protein
MSFFGWSKYNGNPCIQQIKRDLDGMCYFFYSDSGSGKSVLEKFYFSFTDELDISTFGLFNYFMTDKENKQKSCCSGNPSIEKQVSKKDSPCCGSASSVPRINSEWKFLDYWGMFKSRMSNYRMRYMVNPGLYAIGNPDKTSDIFVTANYKLSFDILRKNLKGINAWILVLDTKSINVWCAAGKGSFSTAELLHQIKTAGLKEIVSHNRIILPQLGAVGVSAGEIKKYSGFKVRYGPVKASMIPEYISAGYKKTEKMRTVTFPLFDRIILTPLEIFPALKKFPMLAGIVLLYFGLQPQGIFFFDAWQNGQPFLWLSIIAIFNGALIFPLLLPYIPFRSFALKGAILGLIFNLLLVDIMKWIVFPHETLKIASYILSTTLTSYVALNFTGTSTFTGMSGVKKELRWSLPVYFISIAALIILAVFFKAVEWSYI